MNFNLMILLLGVMGKNSMSASLCLVSVYCLFNSIYCYILQELDRMEEEMFDVMEQNNELERQGARLQRDLAAMDQVKSKVRVWKPN